MRRLRCRSTIRYFATARPASAIAWCGAICLASKNCRDFSEPLMLSEGYSLGPLPPWVPRAQTIAQLLKQQSRLNTNNGFCALLHAHNQSCLLACACTHTKPSSRNLYDVTYDQHFCGVLPHLEAAARKVGPTRKAQSAAAETYLLSSDRHLRDEFIEIESGKTNGRPGFTKALDLYNSLCRMPSWPWSKLSSNPAT